MKVVRNQSVWAALSRVFSSVVGRATIDYIDLTPLEREELTEEYGVCFDLRGGGLYMHLDSWDLSDQSIKVRMEAQDKHSRARRVIKGNGSERTR